MSESHRVTAEAFELALLQRLREILQEHNASPADVLERALHELAHSCRADHVVLATVRADDRARIDVGIGLTPEQVRRGWYGVGEGVIGRVIQTGAPIAAEPKHGEREDFAGAWPLADTTVSRYLCVPIVTRGRGPIGALGIDRERQEGPWMQDELRLLGVVAALLSETASALRTAQEEIEERERESVRWAEITRAICSPAIVGVSQATHQVLGLIGQVAPSDCTVLIQGESGVGKELVAREIHALSKRSALPLVNVNCGAIVGPLAESELFGHIKGAYTGAVNARRGWFGQADGGTIFLDEISEMSLALQVKLLRVLQEHEIHRLGEEKPRQIDVRIVAATNVDLACAVRDGTFREDLYYRLSAFPITVPPLRDRIEDIPILARHFCKRLATTHRRDLRDLSPAVVDALTEHPWPGNVRELENVMLRALLLAQGTRVELHDLPTEIRPRGRSSRTDVETLKDRLSDFERVTILKAMRDAGGSQTKAARALQTTPRILSYRLRRLGVDALSESASDL